MLEHIQQMATYNRYMNDKLLDVAKLLSPMIYQVSLLMVTIHAIQGDSTSLWLLMRHN